MLCMYDIYIYMYVTCSPKNILNTSDKRKNIWSDDKWVSSCMKLVSKLFLTLTVLCHYLSVYINTHKRPRSHILISLLRLTWWIKSHHKAWPALCFTFVFIFTYYIVKGFLQISCRWKRCIADLLKCLILTDDLSWIYTFNRTIV